MGQVLHHLRRAVVLRDGAGLSDGELLERFRSRRDEAAFAALVRRHGPLVMGVCRRVLGHRQDAEDAFQATFLVLVRKAAALTARESLAPWLYGVAYNTARKARAAAAKRRRRERQVPDLPEPAAVPHDLWNELQAGLDRELSRLPAKYRVAIVLCDLEGKSHKEAAGQLGWPQGTLSGRLARARGLLAKRLARRGLALSAGSLAAAWSGGAASASVPAAVGVSTVKAATLLAAGQAAIPAPIAALVEGVLKAMMLTKLAKAVTGFLLAVVLAVGVGFLLSASPAEGLIPQKERAEGKKPAVAATAADLAGTYDTNDALGDEKFTGRKVRVTGLMVRVRRVFVPKGAYLLALETQRAAGQTVPVLLEFDLKARKQLAKVEKYQRVTAEGRCEGRTTVQGREAILFRDCTLVKVEPLPKVRPPLDSGPEDDPRVGGKMPRFGPGPGGNPGGDLPGRGRLGGPKGPQPK
jgi:RNA polymerase sigma factor (sigma-70 family)